MRFLTGLLAALALAGTAATAGQSVAAPPIHAAKKCHKGYTSATIGGSHKCLRVHEFCAHKYDKQYKKYGFRCTHYNKKAHRYVLTYA
jgi:hypothetical protein